MTQTPTSEYDALNFDGTERRGNYRTVAYRIDILHICEGKDAAAILFEIIYRWQTEIRKPEILKEVERRKKANLPALTEEEVDAKMWVWMSYNDFVRECGGAVAYNTVIRMLDYLVETVQILECRENHDSRYADYEYRIRMDVVKEKLKALPATPAFLPKVPKKKEKKSGDSTQMGTPKKRSTQKGRRAHRSTQIGIDSTQKGRATPHLGTEVYPNGGTSHTTHIPSHIEHTDDTYAPESPTDVSASALASATHTPDVRIGEFIAARGGYYHPSMTWLHWDSLNAPAVICAMLTGDAGEDLSRKAEAIRLRDHLSQQHAGIDLLFRDPGTAEIYRDIQGNVIDPLDDEPATIENTPYQPDCAQGEPHGHTHDAHPHRTAAHGDIVGAQRGGQAQSTAGRVAPSEVNLPNENETHSQFSTPPVDKSVHPSAKVEPKVLPQADAPAKPASTGKGKGRVSSKPAPPEFTAEGRKLHDAWCSLFTSPPPAADRTITCANDLYPRLMPWCQKLKWSCKQLLEDMRRWCYASDPDYYRRKGVTLCDLGREFERWQSAKEEELAQAAKPRTPSTRTGTVSGLPRWVAPEVARARTRPNM